MFKKINIRIILPAILSVVAIFVLFFVFPFNPNKHREIQPENKPITQDETSKFYEELSKTASGTKKYINSSTLIENLGDGKFRAEISSTPQVTSSGKEINIAWTQKEEGVFNGENSFFTVSVNGAVTTATALSDISESIKKGDSATWNPQVFLNEKEVNLISEKPVLLKDDPYNKNYHNNVLEWDYGILKRRLELVEGSVFELYSIAENPKGDLVIKSNLEGSLRGGAYYALDGNGKNIRGFKFTDSEKILDSEVLDKAIYPIIVDDSFTSGNADGFIMAERITPYSNARGATSGDYKAVSDTEMKVGQETWWWSGGKYYDIHRSYVYFDTGSISTGTTINSAYLALVFQAKSFYNTTVNNFDVVVQNGQPTYPRMPLDISDFNMSYYSSNGGVINTNNITTGIANNLNLNTTGLGWITKGGYTKFILRSSRDINNNAPTMAPALDTISQELVRISTSEANANWAPKLVVSLTIPAVPQITVTPSPSLYFGTVNVGSSGDYGFTVKNTGTGTLTGSVSGLSAPFSCISGCSYSLTAGVSQSTTLRFTPVSVGSFSGTAIFNSNASNVSIALTGDGAVANCIPDFTTGNYTVNSTALGGTNTCVIESGVTTGTEGGNLTVSSGITIQMNPNSLWLFNAGKNITVDGLIAKPYRTAIIRKGNLSAPTLSVALSAIPFSGTAPLSGVDLTATTTGTATGNIGYQFDCTNNGSWEADTTISNTSYTATDLCNYSSAGTYTAKARVTRSGITAENTTTITVSSSCTDDCSSSQTQTQCSGNYIQTRTCGYYDADSCLDWSSWSNTTNCDNSDGCSGTTYRDYYCSGGSCTYSSTSCSTNCYSCRNGTCNSSCGETCSNCSNDCGSCGPTYTSIWNIATGNNCTLECQYNGYSYCGGIDLQDVTNLNGPYNGYWVDYCGVLRSGGNCSTVMHINANYCDTDPTGLCDPIQNDFTRCLCYN